MTTQYVLLEQFLRKHSKHKDSRGRLVFLFQGFRASAPPCLHPASPQVCIPFTGSGSLVLWKGPQKSLSWAFSLDQCGSPERERENRSCSLQPASKDREVIRVINLPPKLLCISPDLIPSPASGPPLGSVSFPMPLQSTPFLL